jgi:hypothetical protein
MEKAAAAGGGMSRAAWPVATLVPVRLEVPCVRDRRPSYRWVDGYKVIAPNGAEIQPYMQCHEARAFCLEQRWQVAA